MFHGEGPNSHLALRSQKGIFFCGSTFFRLRCMSSISSRLAPGHDHFCKNTLLNVRNIGDANDPALLRIVFGNLAWNRIYKKCFYYLRLGIWVWDTSCYMHNIFFPSRTFFRSLTQNPGPCAGLVGHMRLLTLRVPRLGLWQEQQSSVNPQGPHAVRAQGRRFGIPRAAAAPATMLLAALRCDGENATPTLHPGAAGSNT